MFGSVGKDFYKPCDKVPREVLWWTSRRVVYNVNKDSTMDMNRFPKTNFHDVWKSKKGFPYNDSEDLQ